MIKTKYKDNNKVKLLKEKKPLWIPSIKSFVVLLIFFVILGLISHIGTYNFLCMFEWSIFKIVRSQKLIDIIVAIGAINIGLVFFVAQSLLDKEDPDRSRVLLYESKLFPLITSYVFIIFIILTGDLNYFIYFIIYGLGFFSIYCLANTIRILVRTNDLENSKIKVFTDILNKYFIRIWDAETKRRRINKEIYNLSKEYSENVSFYSFLNEKKEYIQIYSPIEGDIININFKTYRKLINKVINSKDIIELKAKYNNNAYLDTERKTNKSIIIIEPIRNLQLDNKTTLFYIKQDILEKDKKLENYINKYLKLAFKIKQKEDLENESKFEISKIKQRCMNSIKNNDIERLVKSLKLYNELILKLYEFFECYKKEEAESERYAISFERIKPLDWITDDIFKIYIKALDSEDKEIIFNVFHVPFSLLANSIKYKDHLFYQNFITYPKYMYKKGYDLLNINKEVSIFLIDRSWRHLNELAIFYLCPLYKQEKLGKKDFQDFSFYLLKVIQELLKLSYDNNDNKNFTLYLQKLSNIFDTFRNNNVENLYYEIQNLKKLILFGLGSWIYCKYKKSKNEENIEYIKKILDNFSDCNINNITNLFLEANNKYNEFGWDNWEMEEQEEMKAYFVETPNKLESFYLILCLNKLEKLPDNKLNNIEIDPQYDLTIKTERLINELKVDEEFYKGILSSEVANSINKLTELFLKAQKEQKEIELDKKRSTRISDKKVIEFRESVIKNINSSNGFRHIFNYYKLLNFTNRKIKIDKNFGINTLFDKSPFFEDAIVLDDSFEFGDSLVNGENKVIIDVFNKNLNSINQNDFEKYLNNIKDLSKIIIIAFNNASYYFFEKNYKGKYIPNWENEFTEFTQNKYPKELCGIFKYRNHKIPVYEIYENYEEKGIFIIDVTKIGEFIQYLPSIKDFKEDEIAEYLVIKVEEMIKDSKEIEKLLEKPPHWLIEKGNKEEQALYLQEKVLIQIYEWFEFNANDSISGAKIIL